MGTALCWLIAAGGREKEERAGKGGRTRGHGGGGKGEGKRRKKGEVEEGRMRGEREGRVDRG